MPKHIKLALLGGDMRQISVAQELSRFGFTTELWGIDKEFCVFECVLSLYKTHSFAFKRNRLLVISNNR